MNGTETDLKAEIEKTAKDIQLDSNPCLVYISDCGAMCGTLEHSASLPTTTVNKSFFMKAMVAHEISYGIDLPHVFFCLNIVLGMYHVGPLVICLLFDTMYLLNLESNSRVQM